MNDNKDMESWRNVFDILKDRGLVKESSEGIALTSLGFSYAIGKLEEWNYESGKDSLNENAEIVLADWNENATSGNICSSYKIIKDCCEEWLDKNNKRDDVVFIAPLIVLCHHEADCNYQRTLQ